MRKPAVRKGELIVCTNGHVIGEVLRDVALGDMNWGDDAFGNWQQEHVPKVGQTYEPVCAICHAPFFHEGTWEPITSILSKMEDGTGCRYGFVPGDYRQINVRRAIDDVSGKPLWKGYAGEFEVVADTFNEAERRCVEWLRQNPEPQE